MNTIAHSNFEVMKSLRTAIGVIIVIIIIIGLIIYGPTYLKREQSHNSPKETYGAPPGAVRSAHWDELGYRGWAGVGDRMSGFGDRRALVYEANTASSISHMIERSA